MLIQVEMCADADSPSLSACNASDVDDQVANENEGDEYIAQLRMNPPEHIAAAIRLLRAYVEHPCAGTKGYAHARGIWNAYQCNSVLDIQKTSQACILLHSVPNLVCAASSSQVRESAVYFAAISVFYGAEPRLYLDSIANSDNSDAELQLAMRCIRARAVFIPHNSPPEILRVPYNPQKRTNRDGAKRRKKDANPAEARLKSAKLALKQAEGAIDMKAISAINAKSKFLLQQLTQARKLLDDAVNGHNGNVNDNRSSH